MKKIIAVSSIALVFVAAFTPLTITLAASETHEYKSDNRSLFDMVQFRKARRERVKDHLIIDDRRPSKKSSSSSSSFSRSSSKKSSSSSVPALTLETLSTTQRETLRRQLRNNACPQDAEEDYRKICEYMLKKQKQKSVRQGLRNPVQP